MSVPFRLTMSNTVEYLTYCPFPNIPSEFKSVYFATNMREYKHLHTNKKKLFITPSDIRKTTRTQTRHKNISKEHIVVCFKHLYFSRCI